MTATSIKEEVKEKPILFSGPMVKAILEDRKTQTRRVIKRMCLTGPGFYDYVDGSCSYGKPGDRLWVRETWRTEERESDLVDGIRFQADDHFQIIEDTQQASENWVVANNNRTELVWRPSIFLPRWASRITLEITDIRVQRVQEISVDDIVAEGVQIVSGKVYSGGLGVYVQEWRDGWNSINAKRGYSWESNPWVWAISFVKL